MCVRAWGSSFRGNRILKIKVFLCCLYQKQTLQEAYQQRGDFQPTDEAQLIERSGGQVAIVTASRANLKITTKEDLRLAEYLLKALPKPKDILPKHPFSDGDMWR